MFEVHIYTCSRNCTNLSVKCNFKPKTYNYLRLDPISCASLVFNNQITSLFLVQERVTWEERSRQFLKECLCQVGDKLFVDSDFLDHGYLGSCSLIDFHQYALVCKYSNQGKHTSVYKWLFNR